MNEDKILKALAVAMTITILFLSFVSINLSSKLSFLEIDYEELQEEHEMWVDAYGASQDNLRDCERERDDMKAAEEALDKAHRSLPLATIHCSYDLCGCAISDSFAERELCDKLGLTHWYVAQGLCLADANCAACLGLTGGDVSFCFKNAFYP